MAQSAGIRFKVGNTYTSPIARAIGPQKDGTRTEHLERNETTAAGSAGIRVAAGWRGFSLAPLGVGLSVRRECLAGGRSVGVEETLRAPV